MGHLTLSVPDISCTHCKAAIEAAVGALDGVEAVTVDVAGRTVDVDGVADVDAVTTAIVDAGYDVAMAG